MPQNCSEWSKWLRPEWPQWLQNGLDALPGRGLGTIKSGPVPEKFKIMLSMFLTEHIFADFGSQFSTPAPTGLVSSQTHRHTS